MPLPTHLARPIEVLVNDNFDSFARNLYQSLCIPGAEVVVVVVWNDAISPEGFPDLQIRPLVISPGPGHAGVSQAATTYFMGRVPILGVWVGSECLVDVLGGDFAYAGEIMHGKIARARHDNRGCFKDIPRGIQSIRYHSFSAQPDNFPKDLVVTSTESDAIMGVRHRKYTLEAFQYHPESILLEGGDELFANFLGLMGGTWEENSGCGATDMALPLFGLHSTVAAKV